MIARDQPLSFQAEQPHLRLFPFPHRTRHNPATSLPSKPFPVNRLRTISVTWGVTSFKQKVFDSLQRSAALALRPFRGSDLHTLKPTAHKPDILVTITPPANPSLSIACAHFPSPTGVGGAHNRNLFKFYFNSPLPRSLPSPLNFRPSISFRRPPRLRGISSSRSSGPRDADHGRAKSLIRVSRYRLSTFSLPLPITSHGFTDSPLRCCVPCGAVLAPNVLDHLRGYRRPALFRRQLPFWFRRVFRVARACWNSVRVAQQPNPAAVG